MVAWCLALRCLVTRWCHRDPKLSIKTQKSVIGLKNPLVFVLFSIVCCWPVSVWGLNDLWVLVSVLCICITEIVHDGCSVFCVLEASSDSVIPFGAQRLKGYCGLGWPL